MRKQRPAPVLDSALRVTLIHGFLARARAQLLVLDRIVAAARIDIAVYAVLIRPSMPDAGAYARGVI